MTFNKYLFRGAYIHSERQYAWEKGNKDPVWREKDDTDINYHRCYRHLLDKIGAKEKVGIVSEVKETVKDINQIEPNKPMCNNTVVVIENDTMKMRTTKNATREAACTDVCCSVI